MVRARDLIACGANPLRARTSRGEILLTGVSAPLELQTGTKPV